MPQKFTHFRNFWAYPLGDDSRYSPNQNALTVTRLILASAVIWTHSVWRMSGVHEMDELSPFLGVPVSVIAVDGFFFLSGFLVYNSLLRTSSVGRFAAKRLARLWPALIVCVILTVAVGYFITSASSDEYFSGDNLRYLIHNLSLLSAAFFLTGVNCGGEPCVINGSLWTIAWEVRCYVALAALGLTGLAAPHIMKKYIIPFSLFGALLWHVPVVHDLVEHWGGSGIIYYLDLADRLWTVFLMGAATFLFREHIPVNWLLWAALLAVTIICALYQPVPHLPSIFAAYTVLCMGFAPGPSRLFNGDWPDYSYGMYIYAFPVMMALAAIFPFSHHGYLALANVIMVVPLAALSWHLVEKPVLNRMRRPVRKLKEAQA